VYTLKNEEYDIGTSFISVEQLLNAKGLTVFTEEPELKGEQNLTVTVTMADYPNQRHTMRFWVNITLPLEETPVQVTYRPQLVTNVD